MAHSPSSCRLRGPSPTVTGVGANVLYVNWNNTVCPDGSNSNTHGSTCVGYGF